MKHVFFLALSFLTTCSDRRFGTCDAHYNFIHSSELVMKKYSDFRRSASFILSVFVFAFINQSCLENLNGKNSHEKNVADMVGTEDKMLSYNEFLEQVKAFKDKEMYSHFQSSAEEALRSTEKIIFPFPLLPSTTDSVRKIKVNNHTTFTIPVYRRSHTGPVFRNIIIDSTKAGIRAYLAWYFPDERWTQEYKKDHKRSFYGTVYLNNYNDLPSIARPAEHIDLSSVYSSVMVLSSIKKHLCCHDAKHASCGCPVGKKYYFDFLYNTVTVSANNYIPPSSGLPDNNADSGGGTVPDPGVGYDPYEKTKTGTEKTPCAPNTLRPEPSVVPNAAVKELIKTVKANGVNFTPTEIGILNQLK